MRIFLVVVLMAGIVGAFIWRGVFKVTPPEIAYVSGYGEGHRVVGPGLGWHWPWLERVAIINTAAVRRRKIDIALELSDGTTCPIQLAIQYNLADPARAYNWRLAKGLDVSTPPPQFGRQDYTDGEISFTAALRDAARRSSPADADGGTIEKWISSYESPIFADGTRIIATNVESVACSGAFARANREQQHRRSRKIVRGPEQPLANTLQRPEVDAAQAVLEVEIDPGMLITRDRREIELANLAARYVIADEARFETNFGPGQRGHRNIATRLPTLIAAELRRYVGELDAGALPSFDPYAVAGPDTRLHRSLADNGVTLVDLGGASARFMMITYTYETPGSPRILRRPLRLPPPSPPRPAQ